MRLIPRADYTFPGTSHTITAEAWTMHEWEDISEKAVAAKNDKKSFDIVPFMRPKLFKKGTSTPEWRSDKALKDDISQGQVLDLQEFVTDLTVAGVDRAIAAFRRKTGEGAGDAGAAPDGEGVGVSAVGAAER